MTVRPLLDCRFRWLLPPSAVGTWLLAIKRTVPLVAVLFLLLLCSMPPHGLLTDNEENYFQLAERFVTGAAPPDTAVYDSSQHRALNEVLLGGLVVAIGYERAQIVARLVLIAVFSILLCALLDLFGSSPIDGVIVLAVFGLFNQQIMGYEWIFHSYEAKVAAYAFAIAGIVATIARRRSWTSVPLFAVATYFHFLVGIFWFHAALLWRVIKDRRIPKSAIINAASFWLAVAPLIAVIEWKRWVVDPTTFAHSGLPPPDYIYSIIREPWHAAPFVSRQSFRTSWLPGCILSGGMFVGALAIARTAISARLQATGCWLALLLAYLFAALAFSYLFRETGILGKFYPFRPSSLLLLIWLTALLAWLNELVLRRAAVVLKLVAGALVLPPFLVAAVLDLRHEIVARAEIAGDKAMVNDFLRNETPRYAVVLVDPEIEWAFLDIERTTNRFALVLWKFTPTNDPEILEWYKRMEFRRSIFQQGCGADPIYRTDYLLTTHGRGSFLERTCGPPVFETDHFALLRPVAPGARDAAQH